MKSLTRRMMLGLNLMASSTYLSDLESLKRRSKRLILKRRSSRSCRLSRAALVEPSSSVTKERMRLIGKEPTRSKTTARHARGCESKRKI